MDFRSVAALPQTCAGGHFSFAQVMTVN